MTLRARLLAFVTVASVASGFVAGTIVYYSGYHLAKEKVSKVFQLETYFVLHQIERMVFDRKADIESIVPLVSVLLWDFRIKEIEDLFYQIRNTKQVYQNLMIVEPNGKKIVDTNRIGLGAQADYPGFESMLKGAESDFEFLIDPDTNTEVIALWRRLVSKNGQVLGILIAHVPTSVISNLTQVSHHNQLFELPTSLEIIKEDGTVVYSRTRRAVKDLELVASIRNDLPLGKSQVVIERDEEFFSFGHGVDAKSESGNRSGWYLVMRAGRDLVFADLQRGVWLTAFMTFLLMSGFLTVVYFLSKRLTRPLEEASQAAGRFAEGDLGAFDHIPARSDELGQLLTMLRRSGHELHELMTEQSSKERVATLGEMAGNIAHEINNPLQLLSGRLEILDRQVQGDGTPREKIIASVQGARGTVERIAQIIRGLKALSREGQADPFAPVSVTEIIENTAVLSQGKLNAKGIELRKPTLDQMLKVECRNVQISQVVLNLINNAADAISELEDRWIELQVSSDQNTLQISIFNSGPRIPEEIAKRLFGEQFTTKKVGEGTGMGLRISKKIVQDHHGRIYIDFSQEHTCFVVEIPLVQDQANETQKAA